MFRQFLFNRTKLKEFHKEMRFEPIMNKEDINRILKTYNEKE